MLLVIQKTFEKMDRVHRFRELEGIYQATKVINGQIVSNGFQTTALV